MIKLFIKGIEYTDYILECSDSSQFDDGLLIGNTVSKQFNISLDNELKVFDDLLDNVLVIQDDDELFGNFLVYNKPEKMTSIIDLTLYDSVVLTNIAFDTKLDYENSIVTISDQLNEISSLCKTPIEYGNLPQSILDMQVFSYDNTVSCRVVLGWIAELGCCNVFSLPTACITFKSLNINSFKTLSELDTEQFETIEKYSISKIKFDNGSIIPVEQGTDEGKTIYISQDNIYLSVSDGEQRDKAQEIIDSIYNKLFGLTFMIANDFKIVEIKGLELGDLISYEDEFVFMATQIDTTYFNAEYNIQYLYSKFSIENKDKVTNRFDLNTKFRKLTSEFDQEKLKWSVTAEEVKSVGDRVESLNTSLTLEQGKIETLIKDNITIINGNEVTLKEAYSYIQQQIDQINFAISESGGNNKLLNSCGWNGLKHWETSGDVTSTTNNDIRSNTISGYAFNVNAGTMQQTFKTIVGRKYSISCKIKKFTNSCTLIIKNGTSEDVLFNLNDEYIEGWISFSMPIEAKDTSCVVYIESDGEYLMLSDLMVNDGEIPQQWSSSNDEIYTVNVRIDRDGVEVSQDDTNNRTVMNTKEFAGYEGDERVFALNGDTTEVNKLYAKSDVQVGVVKMYAKTSGSKPGLGFAYVKR